MSNKYKNKTNIRHEDSTHSRSASWQVIYQNYDRADEHEHFFKQLAQWCKEEQPDALLVRGDIFDLQQPSAATKKAFTESFVKLHKACQHMKIVITAGNHDSASRIQADSAVWEMANAVLVGVAPAMDTIESDLKERFIVKLDCWKSRACLTPEGEVSLTPENDFVLTPKEPWPVGSFLFGPDWLICFCPRSSCGRCPP